MLVLSNINIRSKFLRGEEVKYISHLDLMKTFERALRRTNIPISYSQGFNPHPNIIFGLPLSVGVTSDAEYVDFELASEIDPQDFSYRLNSQLPEGLRILDTKIKESKNNIMASIDRATYDILVFVDKNIESYILQEKIDSFLQMPCILVQKTSKKGIQDIDIKAMIYKICVKTQHGENLFCLDTNISAGSKANLKPELLLKAINQNFEFAIKIQKIHRTGLFICKDNNILTPLQKEVL